MSGGTGIDRRTLLALLGAAGMTAAAPLLAGCGTSPKAPTITPAQVQKLQDDYARTVFRALRSRNRSLIRTVEAGDLLDRDLDAMALNDHLGAPKTADEFTYPHSVGYPVAASSSDQQQLITVGEYSNTTAPWRNLGLYVRKGPAAPWLRTFSAGLYAADVPHLPTDKPLQPIAPDSSGFAAVPNSVPSLVAKALQAPDSAEAARFGASDVRQRFADDLAASIQRAAAMGTVSRAYTPGSFLIAITIDGGCLVLGSYRFTETTTASPGKTLHFAKQAIEHQRYPGRYHRTVSEWAGMFAAIVPTAGKLTLVSGEERQTGLTVQ